MAGSQDKTEKPTGKRLSEARKRGNIPKSRELNGLIGLAAGVAVLFFHAETLTSETRELMHQLWGMGFRAAGEGALGNGLFVQIIGHLFTMTAPVALTVLVFSIAANLVQTRGFLLSFQAVQPKLSKLNPLEGVKRLVNLRSVSELIKSIVKIVAVGYAAGTVIHSEKLLILSLTDHGPGDIMGVLFALILKLLVRAGGILLVLSLLDYRYQRWQHLKDLMMTKQEVKEEHKQSEGNPQVKSRIRSLQRALARQRMMSQVPKASVVITNPTHYAVALLYRQDMEAPKVVAKGMNRVAQNIIKIARRHRIPVVQNPPLARALYKQVRLEAAIPAALYRAVAKVLAYVYHHQQRAGLPT